MQTFLSFITSQSQELKEIGLLVLRCGIGLIFFKHGLSKITAGPQLWLSLGQAMSNFGISFAPAFWGALAAFSEFLGSIALILGLGTRIAAFFMASVMIVAFIMHFTNKDPWTAISHPTSLFVVFVSLIIMGSGTYSLDAWLTK